MKQELNNTSKLRGVNLGGWLLLEKWMTPQLFDGVEASDEYGYCQVADVARLQRLKAHRDSFITEQDVAWIAEHGLNAVRLPVGHWVFGDTPPYVGCINYVDQLFTWAEQYDVQVLISLHGAPGSQNGRDHSGREGTADWFKQAGHRQATIELARQLARHYSTHPALWGIELLNEPLVGLFNPRLKRYYRRAYEAVKAEADCAVVFNDGLVPRPRRFKRLLSGQAYHDSHCYQVFDPADKRLDLAGHLAKTQGMVTAQLQDMARRHDIIIGEWSAALDEQSLAGLSAAARQKAHAAFAKAQLQAYGQQAGWFYWSYKTEYGGPWSLRDAVARGWLPRNFKNA